MSLHLAFLVRDHHTLTYSIIPSWLPWKRPNIPSRAVIFSKVYELDSPRRVFKWCSHLESLHPKAMGSNADLCTQESKITWDYFPCEFAYNFKSKIEAREFTNKTVLSYLEIALLIYLRIKTLKGSGMTISMWKEPPWENNQDTKGKQEPLPRLIKPMTLPFLI